MSAGFEILPTLYTNRVVSNGVSFNVLVVGSDAIGKTTLINSLFCIEYPDITTSSKFELNIHAYNPVNETVKLKFTIIETKNFDGGRIERSNHGQVLVDYIDAQFEKFFQEGMKVQKTKYNQFEDTRVHCCIYLLTPTLYRNGLMPFDRNVMKLLDERVCLIPVIAKSDTLTPYELQSFQENIMRDINEHNIKIYKPDEDKYRIPLALSASNDKYVDEGKNRRVIILPWGKLDINKDSEFPQLRDLVLKNMISLIQRTDRVHYEQFRSRVTSSDGFIQGINQRLIKYRNRLHSNGIESQKPIKRH